MNKAVFLFTFKRYFHWQVLAIGGSMMALYAVFVGALWVPPVQMTREAVRAMLFGPVIPLIVAYSVVSPQVANAHGLKDGEYLSLLFTRPVTRFSYIFTKWLSGSLFTLCTMLMVGSLATVTAAVIGMSTNMPVESIFDGYTTTDAVLNSCSYTAFVMFVSAFPRRIGVFIMLTVVYLNMFLMAFCGVASTLSFVSFPEVSKGLNAAAQCWASFVLLGVDSYHLMYSATSPFTAAIILVSNIVLYLTLATVVLTMREFYYAND